MGRSHFKAPTHSNSCNIPKLIINTTQLRNLGNTMEHNTTQQKTQLQTLPPKIQPKSKSKSIDSNSKHPKMPENCHLRGAAAYPPTALARRLRAAGADVVAGQVQLFQRRVRLQHFCQSLRPPRNGTRWKR